MLKHLITTVSLCFMILTLTPACAEQDKGTETAAAGKPSSETSAAPATGAATAAPAAEKAMTVMDEPVDFSTPEEVEKSIEKVRQEAGEAQARDLSNALGYILAYDLSLGRDKEKMYKKLNGRTPNEIIAKMKR